MRHKEGLKRGRWLRGSARALWIGFLGAILSVSLSTNPARAATVWDFVHQNPDTLLKECEKFLGSRPPPKGEQTLIGLSLDMSDAEVACRLITAYGKKTDVPMRVVDSYVAHGDEIWRQKMRDICAKRMSNVTGCVESTAGVSNTGISLEDMRSAEQVRDRDFSPSSPEYTGDWNRPDVTLIVFEWTPCTPFLVKRGFDHWRAKHLNIITTGASPLEPEQGLPHPKQRLPDQRGRTDELSVGPLPMASPDPAKNVPDNSLPQLANPTGTAMDTIPEAKGGDSRAVCLRGVQVRTTLRDRWANYAHIALRESASPSDCAENDNGPAFPVDYPGPSDSPTSRVTDIVWKNSWLDRQQWLVMVRDHFLDRLRTTLLDPNYPLPSPAHLVDWGPDVCYGGMPSGRHYYWGHGGKPPRNCDFEWSNLNPSKALETGKKYVELKISFNPNATLTLSHGPYYHDHWERAQARFIAREVERRARYWSAGPLAQNDDTANARDSCAKPMPAHPDAKTRNAEAPRRDAITPRFGDLMPEGEPPFPLPEPATNGPPSKG